MSDRECNELSDCVTDSEKRPCPRCGRLSGKSGFTTTKLPRQRYYCYRCGIRFSEKKLKLTLDKYDKLRPKKCDICGHTKLVHNRSFSHYSEYYCGKCKALHHVDKNQQV